jgi:glycosyltransferase involved in cell wall biosynthesis
MQEGLASGAVVVGSATGGTKEIIINEENGLLFPAENSRGLANALNQLMDDPNLRRKLAENGRQTAIEKFDIVRMVREINSYILNVVKDASPTISQQGAIRSV